MEQETRLMIEIKLNLEFRREEVKRMKKNIIISFKDYLESLWCVQRYFVITNLVLLLVLNNEDDSDEEERPSALLFYTGCAEYCNIRRISGCYLNPLVCSHSL